MTPEQQIVWHKLDAILAKHQESDRVQLSLGETTHSVNFDMSRVGHIDPHCGTSCCLAGHLGFIPEAAAIGITTKVSEKDAYGESHLRILLDGKHVQFNTNELAERLGVSWGIWYNLTRADNLSDPLLKRQNMRELVPSANLPPLETSND